MDIEGFGEDSDAERESNDTEADHRAAEIKRQASDHHGDNANESAPGDWTSFSGPNHDSLSIAAPPDASRPDGHPSEDVPSRFGHFWTSTEESFGNESVYGRGEYDDAMSNGDPSHEDQGESSDLLKPFFGGAEGGSGAEEINDGAFDEDGDSEDDQEARLVNFVVGHEPDQPHGELSFPCHEEPAECERPIDFGD